MKIPKRSIFLLTTMCLSLLTYSISCRASQPIETTPERDEIIAYIDEMLPVMEKHADWYDDQNALGQARGLNYEEAMTRIINLNDRMEQIYMDVETSIPPPILRDYKRKWSQVCQLNMQTLTLMLQALESKDIGLLDEINELTFQANDKKTEMDEELMDLLSKHNIFLEEFSR